jgi:hypothetical protein
MDNQDEYESYSEVLDTTMSNGGGCAEAWAAAQEARTNSTPCCDDIEADRRGFLRRTVGATTTSVLSVLGLSGMASGTGSRSQKARMLEQQKTAMKPYREVSTARAAVERHGSTLLEILAEEDLLESADVDSLGLEEMWDPDMRVLTPNSATVDGITEKGIPTAHIQIAKQTEDYRLEIFVQPQLKRTYAHLMEMT